MLQNGESKPVPSEKRSSVDEKPKKKTLPELDKYWKVVNDDPTDFTGWTYLLQYVDQEVSKNNYAVFYPVNVIRKYESLKQNHLNSQ